MLKVLRIYLAAQLSVHSGVKWCSLIDEPYFLPIGADAIKACGGNRDFALFIPVYGVFPLSGVWGIRFPWDDYKNVPAGSDYYPTRIAEIADIVRGWVDSSIDDLLNNSDICMVANIEARGNYLRSKPTSSFKPLEEL